MGGRAGDEKGDGRRIKKRDERKSREEEGEGRKRR